MKPINHKERCSKESRALGYSTPWCGVWGVVRTVIDWRDVTCKTCLAMKKRPTK